MPCPSPRHELSALRSLDVGDSKNPQLSTGRRGFRHHAQQEAFTQEAKRIGREAGYRYVVYGPSEKQLTNAAMTPEDRQFARQASWTKGETEGKWTDSGLEIASDYPMTSVQKAAFPSFACAGFDCLANKGVLLVTLKLPEQSTPVAIATAHLNSRHSSGVSDARSLYAYRRQLDFLTSFFATHRNATIPLIFAGDFNVSEFPRRTALFEEIERWWPDRRGTSPRDGLRTCLARLSRHSPALPDARLAMLRARDWQFVVPGRHAGISAIGLSVPFGHDAKGSMLSDHVGYVVDYLTRELSPTA